MFDANFVFHLISMEIEVYFSTLQHKLHSYRKITHSNLVFFQMLFIETIQIDPQLHTL